MGSTDYREAFITRVFSARERAGITQDKMAHLLHTSQPTYSKYETRSLLPHRHMESFCIACRVSVEWLVTGRGEGVALLDRPEPIHRPGRKKTKRKAA